MDDEAPRANETENGKVNTAIQVYGGDGNVPAPYVPRAAEAVADRIDLRTLFAMFRRRIGIFLAVLLAVLVIGLVLTMRQTPMYMASAQVALDVDQPQLTPVAAGERPDLKGEPTANFVDTQVEIIKSQEFAQRAVKALNLASDPRFAVAQEPQGLGAWLSGLVTARPRQAPPTAADAQAAAAEYLRSGIVATRVASTYALDISFTGPDPDEAVRIANAYAKLYTSGSLTEKQAESKAANAMIAQRLETLRVQAQAADAAEQRYRMQNNLPSTQGLSLTEQEISSYNTQVAESRAQAAEDQARLATAQAQLRSGSAGDDVGEALGSSVVADLRGEQARLASEVAQLTTRYGARHPDVQRAKNQLATIDRRVAEEIRRVISNLAAKARVSQQRLASLTGTLQTAQSSLANNNAALVGLNELVQRNATAKSLYESYLTKYQEQIARLGTEQADASVLQYASDPGGPVSPNLFLNMLLALTLGVGLGLAAAFVTEMTFPGITTGDEVEQRLGVNYLGSVPLIESVMKTSDSPAVAVVSEPRSAFAESIRSLRASIQFATSTPPRVIAITSALPQEGKTTISICLARSMGQSGERVVLVDCDLRRHGVSRFLRADAERPGLIKVLRGEATLEQALVPDSATGMMVLPVAGGDDFDAELMIGEKMDALLEQLKARFDVVLLDTAPVLPIADARLILGKADAAVFAMRWRKTPDHAVRSALRLLPLDRVQLAGVVLSQVDIRKQARFGYGDESYYYREYKSYYA